LGNKIVRQSIFGQLHYYNHQTTNDEQVQIMLKLMENVMSISQKLIELLDKIK